MFGKRSSGNDKFVMAMGRKVGNIKTAKAAPAGAGKKTVKKAPPAKMQMDMSDKGLGKKLPSFDKMKRGVKVNQNRPQSLGKANTFDAED